MNIVIPEDIVQVARLTEEEVLWEITVTFLKQKRVTLEQASRLVRMSQPDLLRMLTNKLISTPYNAEDVQRIVDTLRKQGW